MSFPNPANYYLPTLGRFETEIANLDYMQLARLNWRLSGLLDDVIFEQMKFTEDTEFYTYGEMSADFEQWVLTAKIDELINLTRWITERLAYLYQDYAS
ncbi:hypothetical protein [Pseudanabaena sp. 'Roaring Creek']|uniref:hypothetical protein n=1 Tax=Pseudanabaena sp. 'Roaring Creek' TaxID=1681830 RepID=UPI0006D78D6E|nr:hypothetical protein [Pseudanabaena sp. 'Roaring Creek']